MSQSHNVVKSLGINENTETASEATKIVLFTISWEMSEI